MKLSFVTRCMAATALAVAAASIGFPVSAQAATRSADATKHCSVNVDTGAFKCSTGSGSTVPADTLATSGSYLLGIGYVNFNYGGTSLSFTANSPCNSSTPTHTFNYMPSGWNDVISSFKVYNKCVAELYPDNYLAGGNQMTVTSGVTSMGSRINDKTSSVSFWYDQCGPAC